MPYVTRAELEEALTEFRLAIIPENPAWNVCAERLERVPGTVADPHAVADALHRELGAYAARTCATAPDSTPGAATPGQAAQRAWEGYWATAAQRGRDTPGYDEQAALAAGWDVTAEAAIDASPAGGFPADVPLRLARCPEHPGKVHAQIGSAGEWACLRGLADVAEAGVIADADEREWAVKAAQACQDRDDAREKLAEIQAMVRAAPALASAEQLGIVLRAIHEAAALEVPGA